MTKNRQFPANKLLIAVIVLVCAMAVYVVLDRERVARWFAGDIIQKEQAPLKRKITELEDKLAKAAAPPVQPELLPLPDEALQEEPLEEPPPLEAGPAFKPTQAATHKSKCDILNDDLRELFSLLDKRQYLVELNPEGIDTEERFEAMAGRLFSKPPIVTRETDNLLQVLQNSAHFFRTLGKQDIRLMIEILRHEGPSMEPMFELMYRTVQAEGTCPPDGLALSLPFRGSYEYSGYFLNTLGGSSYLLRRDSRSRMLAQYYSILILDDANRQKNNFHGLDIRRPIASLITDMQGSSTLKDRARYLKKLKGLRNKYKKKFG